MPQLGNRGAAIGCQNAIATTQAEERVHVQQLQQQQMMLQLMGSVFRNIPGR
jgi:hypothetical protein